MGEFHQAIVIRESVSKIIKFIQVAALEDELEEWLIEHDIKYIHGRDGKHYYEFQIFSEEDMMAIKLRWL